MMAAIFRHARRIHNGLPAIVDIARCNAGFHRVHRGLKGLFANLGHFGVFVLVSSDSDFTRLASRIREQGLTVIGIGEAKAPDALKNACNRFVTIENLVEPDTKASAPKKANLDAAQKLLIAAMEKIDQEDEWYQLGRLGQQVLADNPDFDTRTYGYSKLSALVEDMKQLETKRNSGNQLIVRRQPRRGAR